MLGQEKTFFLSRILGFPGSLPFCLYPPSHLSNVKVCRFITPWKSWDMDAHREVFFPEDIDQICSLPLSKFVQSDSWMWHYGKNSIFSVRSAYRLAMDIKNRELPSSSSVPSLF